MKILSKLAITPAGVIVHVLLLIAFIKDPLKCFRNSSTFLVGNLALSDLLLCLSAFGYYHYREDPVWFEISQFLWRFLPSVSILSIVSISIDRFIVVVYPLRHRYLIKRKILVAWVTSVWLISIIYPGKRLIVREKHDEHITNTVALVVVLFSAAMYAATYLKLRKQTRSVILNNSSDSHVNAARVLKEKKFLTTIIVTVCITYLCMLPYLMLYPVVVTRGVLNRTSTEVLYIVLSALYNCSFAVNPFIYLARLSNYRKTFYLLYCRKLISCWKA